MPHFNYGASCSMSHVCHTKNTVEGHAMTTEVLKHLKGGFSGRIIKKRQVYREHITI